MKELLYTEKNCLINYWKTVTLVHFEFYILVWLMIVSQTSLAFILRFSSKSGLNLLLLGIDCNSIIVLINILISFAHISDIAHSKCRNAFATIDFLHLNWTIGNINRLHNFVEILEKHWIMTHFFILEYIFIVKSWHSSSSLAVLKKHSGNSALYSFTLLTTQD